MGTYGRGKPLKNDEIARAVGGHTGSLSDEKIKEVSHEESVNRNVGKGESD